MRYTGSVNGRKLNALLSCLCIVSVSLCSPHTQSSTAQVTPEVRNNATSTDAQPIACDNRATDTTMYTESAKGCIVNMNYTVLCCILGAILAYAANSYALFAEPISIKTAVLAFGATGFLYDFLKAKRQTYTNIAETHNPDGSITTSTTHTEKPLFGA